MMNYCQKSTTNAQYTSPMSTRLNYRVESRRRCVNAFATTVLVEKLKTEHVENLSSRVGCRIGNWVTTADE